MSSGNPVDANPELPERVPIEGNEKANKDASASNKPEPLLEDCAVVNRETSGMRIHEVEVPYFNPNKSKVRSQQTISNAAFVTFFNFFCREQ